MIAPPNIGIPCGEHVWGRSPAGSRPAAWRGRPLVGEAGVSGRVGLTVEDVAEHGVQRQPGADRHPDRRPGAGAARQRCRQGGSARISGRGHLDELVWAARRCPGHLEEDLLEGAFGSSASCDVDPGTDQRPDHSGVRRAGRRAAPVAVELAPSSPAIRMATASARSTGATRTRSGARPAARPPWTPTSSLPSEMTPTRSQISSTSASRWLDSSTVWPPCGQVDDEAPACRPCRPGRARWSARRARSARARPSARRRRRAAASCRASRP